MTVRWDMLLYLGRRQKQNRVNKLQPGNFFSMIQKGVKPFLVKFVLQHEQLSVVRLLTNTILIPCLDIRVFILIHLCWGQLKLIYILIHFNIRGLRQTHVHQNKP